MDAMIKLDRPYHRFSENEIVSGELIFSSNSKLKCNDVGITLKGGLYLNYLKNDNPLKPDLKILSSSKSNSTTTDLNIGANSVKFSFRLTPTKGRTLLYSYRGSSFSIQYYLFYAISVENHAQGYMGKLEIFIKKPIEDSCVKFNPVDVFISKSNQKSTQNCIFIHLDNSVYYQEAGICGYIVVKGYLDEIYGVWLKLTRKERMLQPKVYLNEKDYEFKKFMVVDGNPMRDTRLPFVFHIEVNSFSPTVSNSICSISYSLQIIVQTASSFLTSQSVPIQLACY